MRERSEEEKEIIEAGVKLHDEQGCQCDRKYLMSCTKLTSAIMVAGGLRRLHQEGSDD